MTDITERHVGVSGTRERLTSAQEHAFFNELVTEVRSGTTHVHHGACKGADQFTHYSLLAFRMIWLIVHPPVDTKYSAFPELLRTTRRLDLEPKPYKDRDQDIVDGLMPDGTTNDLHRLIAAPAYAEDDDRSKRSGTWLTVRLADAKGVPVTIVDRNGDVFPYVSAKVKSSAASAE